MPLVVIGPEEFTAMLPLPDIAKIPAPPPPSDSYAWTGIRHRNRRILSRRDAYADGLLKKLAMGVGLP